MINKIKFVLTGPLLILLGGYALTTKFQFPDANLPFWPFDGVLAIAGGIFVSYWTFRNIVDIFRQPGDGDDGTPNDDRY